MKYRQIQDTQNMIVNIQTGELSPIYHTITLTQEQFVKIYRPNYNQCLLQLKGRTTLNFFNATTFSHDYDTNATGEQIHFNSTTSPLLDNALANNLRSMNIPDTLFSNIDKYKKKLLTTNAIIQIPNTHTPTSTTQPSNTPNSTAINSSPNSNSPTTHTTNSANSSNNHTSNASQTSLNHTNTSMHS